MFVEMTIGRFLDGSPIKGQVSSDRWQVVGSDLNEQEHRNGWSTEHQCPSLYLRNEKGEVEYFSMDRGVFVGINSPSTIPHEWICKPDIIGQFVRVSPDYENLKIVWESDLLPIN